MADLGPHRPDSHSSSLVPYEEDSNPKEDRNQQEVTPNQMEIENPATAEALQRKEWELQWDQETINQPLPGM